MYCDKVLELVGTVPISISVCFILLEGYTPAAYNLNLVP